MHILNIIIIIIVVILITFYFLMDSKIETFVDLKESDVERRWMSHTFPFSSPLNRNFYIRKSHEYSTYVMNPKDLKLMKDIVGGNNKFEYPKSNTESESEFELDIDSVLNRLDNGDLDFALISELYTHRLTTKSNVRFICALYKPMLLLLAPDDSGLLEFGDIGHYRSLVKIGVSRLGSPAHIMLKSIIDFYGEDVSRNVEVVHVDNSAVYDKDYNIYCSLGHQPDKMIQSLTEEVSSHLMTMTLINKGDYTVTDSEKPFYVNNPFYSKEMFDLINGISIYPYLSRVGSSSYSIFIPTIKSRYILLTNKYIIESKINDVLKNVMVKIVNKKLDMDMTEIGTTLADILVHNAAINLYREHNIYDNDEIGMYTHTSHLENKKHKELVKAKNLT